MPRRFAAFCRLGPLAALAAFFASAPALRAQQKIDEEYTRLIKQFLRDPRISTELVNYLPASDKVPSPLKGRFPHRGFGATHARTVVLRFIGVETIQAIVVPASDSHHVRRTKRLAENSDRAKPARIELL